MFFRTSVDTLYFYNLTTTTWERQTARADVEFYQVLATEPTIRPDGSTLQEGDLWFNTASDALSIYNGTSFIIIDDTPAWVPINDPHYLDNGQAIVFYDLVPNPDTQTQATTPFFAERASTALDSYLLNGAPTATTHTRFAIVKLDNTRYFTDNDIDTFRANFFELDIQDGTLANLPLVRSAVSTFAQSGLAGDPTVRPDTTPLQDGDVWIRTDLNPHVLYTYSTTTSLWTRVQSDVTAANVDNLAIRPESVLIGGTNGDFLLQERQAAVIVGGSLAAQHSTSYTKDAARNSITLAVGPAGLAEGQDLYLQVDLNPNDSEIPAGGYLADYTIEVVNAVTEHRFSNIRPVNPTTMITGDALDLRPGTITGFIFEVFADMSRGVFVLEDTADGIDIFRVEVDNDVIDFAHTPTVNGNPIVPVDQDFDPTSENPQSGTAVAEAIRSGVQYITSSDVPPLPINLVAGQTYTMRVTNNTSVDTPGFTLFRFCLLYTSPSPRDS